MKTEFAYINTF